jgi:nucleoside-diphosphate-sugar epimerase
MFFEVLFFKWVSIKFDQNPLNYSAAFACDLPHSRSSVEKARVLLGYSPSHNVIEGLEEAVEWFRKNL